MTKTINYEIIIIGGSYAGLSAAMSLGRALRQVLVIDSGSACNKQTPHSHNFITQDGEKPQAIAAKAKAQLLSYDSITLRNDVVINVKKSTIGFEVFTAADLVYNAKKLVFATGVRDIMPHIEGFSSCWGITVIHCPYCHGYEVKNEITGIIANGENAFHYAQLIHNWTKDLTVFTNGKSTLTEIQVEKITKNNIEIIEKEILLLNHENGHVKQIVFADGSQFNLKAIYSRPSYEQHCPIPEMLGCELTEHKLIKVDMFQQTTDKDIYACGDNCSPMRSVANAVATGNLTGAAINNVMTAEEFSE